MHKSAVVLLLLLVLPGIGRSVAQPVNVRIRFCNCDHSYFIYQNRIQPNDSVRWIPVGAEIRVMGFCFQGYGKNACFDYNGDLYYGNDVNITIQDEGTIFFRALESYEAPALFNPGDVGVLAVIIILFVISYLIIDAYG